MVDLSNASLEPQEFVALMAGVERTLDESRRVRESIQRTLDQSENRMVAIRRTLRKAGYAI